MEPLKDPLEDRVLKELVPPPHEPLSEALLYPYKDSPAHSKTKAGQPAPKSEKAANMPDWQVL